MPSVLRLGLRRLASGRTPPATGGVRTPPATGVHPQSVCAYLHEVWPETCSEVRCHEISGQHVLISHRAPPEALRPGGYVSGPFQFTVADLGMWCMTWGHGGFEAMALTSELSIRFLRPAIGSCIWARVELNAASGRSVVSTATLWARQTESVEDAMEIQAGRAKPCSVAQGTYVLPRSS